MRKISFAALIVFTALAIGQTKPAHAWLYKLQNPGLFDECAVWGGRDWYVSVCTLGGQTYAGQMHSGNYFK